MSNNNYSGVFGTRTKHVVMRTGAYYKETLALSSLLSSVLLTNNSWSELSPLGTVVTTTLTVVLMELYTPIIPTHPPNLSHLSFPNSNSARLCKKQ